MIRTPTSETESTVFGIFQNAGDIYSKMQLLNDEQRRIGSRPFQRETLAIDLHDRAALLVKHQFESGQARQSYAERIQLDIGMEAVFEVPDGLLPDHRLDAFAKRPGGDKNCRNQDGERNRNDDE